MYTKFKQNNLVPFTYLLREEMSVKCRTILAMVLRILGRGWCCAIETPYKHK